MKPNPTLLLGLLGLQMGFLRREMLQSAIQLWVRDKSQSLSQIFLNEGGLRAEQCSLLETLIQELLRAHPEDSVETFAAVCGLVEVLHELQHLAGEESLPTATLPITGDADPYATRQQPLETTAPEGQNPLHPRGAGPRPTSAQRFEVLRPHAHGGLGEVFVAHDQELDREVALKQIRSQHADHQESRTRFLLEAEITGCLEHPGIVPVYSLGTQADGRPFYAMRFIRGETLDDAIKHFHPQGESPANLREKSLELRKLLRCFLDVCNTLAYAHSRGVLHRDMKPSNIMLGPYGETLVVDWGLAKLLGQSSEGEQGSEGERPLVLGSLSGSMETLPGTALGTPRFMSPEQAAGKLPQLTPASDVYSLGATLYCLLTGKPPIEGTTLNDILDKVQRGDVAVHGRIGRYQ